MKRKSDLKQKAPARNRPERAWFIQGYEGLSRVYFKRLSPTFSEKEIGAFLQRLACRYLSADEICSASLRRTMKGYSPLLEIRKEPRERVILSVGEFPHFIASMHTELEFEDMARI